MIDRISGYLRGLLLFAGLVPVATIAVAAAEQSSAAVPDRAATVVRVMTAEPELRPVPIRTSGRVRYGEVRSLSFKVSGYISELSVNEGDAVRKGELLASLDPAEVEARMARAGAVSDKYRADVKRLRALHRRSLVSADALEQAERGLAEAQAEWEIARHNLRHARITAPTDGIVVSRPLDRGEYAGSGQTVLEIAPRQSGWVIRFGLADRDLVRLQIGDPARVVLDAWDGLLVDGEITELGTRADGALGVFEVEVRLSEPPRALRDGFFARVSLIPVPRRPYVFLPLTALTSVADRRAEVMVVGADNRAERRSVRVQHLLSEEVAVAEGLQEGDRVVVEGGAWLQVGEPLQPVTGYKLAVR